MLFCAAAGGLRFSRMLPEEGAPRFSMIARLSDVTINRAAATVVALDKTVAVPRGPNTV